MKGRRLSFTMRYVLLFGILLFAANAVLGTVVLNQSKAAMRVLICKNMNDVSNSAAASLDADALASLTEDDVDGPVFNGIKNRLLVFQNSADIHYIYTVKRDDEGKFVFTVDPDPLEPAAFGEEIVMTPALVEAASGVATVDDTPATDRWGTYYSAFSPVMNSSNEVVGIVGVDFDTAWYDAQVSGYMLSIAAVTSLSVLLGGVVVALIFDRVRARFKDLDAELSELSNDVDILMGEMASYSSAVIPSSQTDSGEMEDGADELEVLSGKIRTMKAEMGMYLDYMRAQAYTDSLTRVGNTTAYHEVVRELDGKIKEGTADFCVAVFDLNGLKEINDTYGHECGDYYIQGTAHSLQKCVDTLDEAGVFRIGGDEFAVVAEGCDQARREKGLQTIEAAIADFNKAARYPATLVVSQGVSCYMPGSDSSFKDVFARADEAMYGNKREYYRSLGTRSARD